MSKKDAQIEWAVRIAVMILGLIMWIAFGWKAGAVTVLFLWFFAICYNVGETDVMRPTAALRPGL